MSRRNEFAEIVSATFALIVFVFIIGAFIQVFTEQATNLGYFWGLFGFAIVIVIAAVIIKIILSIKNLFD